MGESVKDPVCGWEVHSHDISALYLGTEYGFCSVECRARFLAFSRRYAGHRDQ